MTIALQQYGPCFCQTNAADLYIEINVDLAAAKWDDQKSRYARPSAGPPADGYPLTILKTSDAGWTNTLPLNMVDSAKILPGRRQRNSWPMRLLA
ncbi:hypothetical protein PY730_27885 (plasmid) [Klebsiella pneumoniae]|nr:hypothetical protein PY730_27885 [Klebsiella pneumoniae]